MPSSNIEQLITLIDNEIGSLHDVLEIKSHEKRDITGSHTCVSSMNFWYVVREAVTAYQQHSTDMNRTKITTLLMSADSMIIGSYSRPLCVNKDTRQKALELLAEVKAA